MKRWLILVYVLLLAGAAMAQTRQAAAPAQSPSDTSAVSGDEPDDPVAQANKDNADPETAAWDMLKNRSLRFQYEGAPGEARCGERPGHIRRF